MTMTIGVFMLTIGTFLGGIWANESWGRYWGWDPKETWALVSVLVYATILHLRFIPGLKNKFVFNSYPLIFGKLRVSCALEKSVKIPKDDSQGTFPE